MRYYFNDKKIARSIKLLKNLLIDIYDPIVDKKDVLNEYSVKLLDKINFLMNEKK